MNNKMGDTQREAAPATLQDVIKQIAAGKKISPASTSINSESTDVSIGPEE